MIASERDTSDGTNNGGNGEAERREGDSGGLESLLDDLNKAGDETVSVGDVISAFEYRSTGALIAVFGLIAALPVVGGIPGMSMLTASLILLIVAQSFLSAKGGIWVPRFLGKREIDHDTLEKAVEKSRPWARRVDGWLRPRLRWLTQARPQRAAMIVAVVLLAITFYPLAFVPYGVTPASLGVLALGLALMTGDGVLALIGYAMIVATAATAVMIL